MEQIYRSAQWACTTVFSNNPRFLFCISKALCDVAWINFNCNIKNQAGFRIFPGLAISFRSLSGYGGKTPAIPDFYFRLLPLGNKKRLVKRRLTSLKVKVVPTV